MRESPLDKLQTSGLMMCSIVFGRDEPWIANIAAKGGKGLESASPSLAGPAFFFLHEFFGLGHFVEKLASS